MPDLGAYLIVSPKHTMPEHRYVTFWRADSKGYCWPLSWAGRYPRKALADICWYPDEAFAVPEAAVLALTTAPRPGDIDGDAGPVVSIEHLAQLRKLAFTAVTKADKDDMHHALGRPEDPWKEPYRNRYVCGAGGKTAKRFEDLGLWDFVCTINQGREAIYEVNETGLRLIMRDVMDARHARLAAEKAAGIRDYRVVIDRLDEVTQVRAKSRAAAKYDVYLRLADVGWAHDGFNHFLKVYQPRVLVA